MIEPVSEQDNYIKALENTIGLFEERIAELEFASEDAGWQALTSEPKFEFSRDFLQRIIARSRLYFLHNPLINRGVTLQADYVFAQGVNIQARDKKIDDVVQKFLDDPKNKKEIGEHAARLLLEQTLMVDGNIFFVLFTDRQNTGKVQIRTILVDEIREIIRNPDDANDVWFYKRVYWRQDGTAGGSTITVYYPDIDLNRMEVNIEGFTDGNILWDAPIYHCKVGSLSKAGFGVPETYAALDWAQAFKNFLENWATIVRSYARFSFQLTMKGGTNSISAAKRKLGSGVTSGGTTLAENNPSPTVASIFAAQKEGVQLEPIRTSGATTSARDGRELRMMVAAALGVPDTFFGDVDVGNLATARTLDRPTELKFRSRQKLWEDAFQRILQYVIKWAFLANNGPIKTVGRPRLNMDGTGLDVPSSVDTHVEVAFPPILEHSITDRIDAVANAVTLNGKSLLADSPELAKITIRLMFQALGLPDVDNLMNRVDSELENVANSKQQPATNNQPTNNDNPTTRTPQ